MNVDNVGYVSLDSVSTVMCHTLCIPLKKYRKTGYGSRKAGEKEVMVELKRKKRQARWFVLPY